MRTVKMTALIGESFDRTLEILFRPFSVKKWLRLILIALLAGMLFGGSGSGGGGNNNSSTKQETGKASSQDIKTAGGEEAKAASKTSMPAPSPEVARRNAIIAVTVVVALLAFLIFFIVFMTWVGARFKFVWLNAVINNTGLISEPFSRHRRSGNSFFKLSLTLIVLFFLVLGLLIAVVGYGMVSAGAFQKGFAWTPAVALKIFLAPALTGIIFLIAFLLFAFLMDHFVVLIMAFDECTVLKALKKLGAILSVHWKDLALFTFIFFLLSIAAGTFAGVLALLAIIVLLIAAALIFGLPFLLLWLVLKAKAVFTIYAIIAAIPSIFVAITTLLAMSLPFAVFFRVFSLKYLLSLGAGYGPESLEKYSARKAESRPGRAPVVISVIVVFLLFSVSIGGLLAAIAIPNFMRARQTALEKKAVETRNLSVQGAQNTQ